MPAKVNDKDALERELKRANEHLKGIKNRTGGRKHYSKVDAGIDSVLASLLELENKTNRVADHVKSVETRLGAVEANITRTNGYLKSIDKMTAYSMFFFLAIVFAVVIAAIIYTVIYVLNLTFSPVYLSYAVYVILIAVSLVVGVYIAFKVVKRVQELDWS
jgi:Flp pilus assembly protein TadB